MGNYEEYSDRKLSALLESAEGEEAEAIKAEIAKRKELAESSSDKRKTLSGGKKDNRVPKPLLEAARRYRKKALYHKAKVLDENSVQSDGVHYVEGVVVGVSYSVALRKVFYCILVGNKRIVRKVDSNTIIVTDEVADSVRIITSADDACNYNPDKALKDDEDALLDRRLYYEKYVGYCTEIVTSKGYRAVGRIDKVSLDFKRQLYTYEILIPSNDSGGEPLKVYRRAAKLIRDSDESTLFKDELTDRYNKEHTGFRRGVRN